MTLLLAPPSRRANDVAISLRGPAGDPAVADLVAREAMGASCPADKATRVRSAILHSGRYDCRVSHSAIAPRNLQYLDETLGEVGASILVLDDDGDVVERRETPKPGTLGAIIFTSRHRTRRAS